MPALHAWTNPDTAAPITDVLPMGSLQNTIRSFNEGRSPAIGLISIGDALLHTDPVLSLGLSSASSMPATWRPHCGRTMETWRRSHWRSRRWRDLRWRSATRT